MNRGYRCNIGGVIMEVGGMVNHKGEKLKATKTNADMPELNNMYFVEGNSNFCFAVDLPNMDYYAIDVVEMHRRGYESIGTFDVCKGQLSYKYDGKTEKFGIETIITAPYIYPVGGLMVIVKDAVFVNEKKLTEDVLANVNSYFFDVSDGFVVIADFDKYAVISTDTIIRRFKRRFLKAEDVKVYGLNDRLEVECKINGSYFGRTYGAYELDIKEDLYNIINTDADTLSTDAKK